MDEIPEVYVARSRDLKITYLLHVAESFWEANRFSASQEILPHSQVPATGTFPEPDKSSPCPRIPLPEEDPS